MVEYLEANDLRRRGPFDATRCVDAEPDDLAVEGIARFIGTAR